MYIFWYLNPETRVCYNTPDNNQGGGDNNNQNNQNNNQSNDGNNQNNNQNNSGDNFDFDVNSPWNLVAEGDDNNSNNNNQNNNQGNNNNQNNQNNQNLDKEAKFDNYVKGLGLTKDIDFTKIGIEDDDQRAALQGAFETVAAKVMRATLKNSAELSQHYSKKAQETAVDTAQKNYDRDAANKFMDEKLQFTSGATIAPVARQALQSFMENGNKTVQEATDLVGKMFEHVAKTYNKVNPPQGRPGSNGMFEPVVGDDNPEDWMDILSGKS